MKKVKKILRAIAGFADRICLSLAVIAAAAMALHVSAEVLARAVLGTPLSGTIEIVAFIYMVALTFLPLVHAQTTHEHVAADAIANSLPDRVAPYTDHLGRLLSLGVALFLLWAVTDMALRQTATGEVVEASHFAIPVWPSRWFLPLGLTAMIIVMLRQLVSPDTQTKTDGDPPMPGDRVTRASGS